MSWRAAILSFAFGASAIGAGFLVARLRGVDTEPPARSAPEREAAAVASKAARKLVPPAVASSIVAEESPPPSASDPPAAAELTEAIEALSSAASANARSIESAAFRSAALALRGRYPTQRANGRGEASHPAVLRRVLLRLLGEAGQPLDRATLAKIDELVLAYDEAFAERDATYDEGTTLLRRLVDEVEAKQGFLDALEELLTPEQLALLARRAPEGERWPRLFSPTLMLDVERPRFSAEVEDFAPRLADELARELGLPSDALAPLARDYFTAIAPLFAPGEARPPSERDLLAGSAQAVFFEEILALETLGDKGRRRLTEELGWIVPAP